MAGAQAYTKVEVDRGKVRMVCVDDEVAQKHQTIAAEFKAAIEAAKLRQVTNSPHKEMYFREYISDYRNYRMAADDAKKFQTACNGVQHGRRIKKIEACFHPVASNEAQQQNATASVFTAR